MCVSVGLSACVCVGLCVSVGVSEVSVSATDQRILPSADSSSELRFDTSDSPSLRLRHHDLPSVHADELFEGYTRGHACHRSPFQRPSDSAAHPLQHPISDEVSQQPDMDCHVLPSTSSENIVTCQRPVTETTSSSTINAQLMDGYATARVKCL